MAHKILSSKQIEQMRRMVSNGVYPVDIANHYKIGISTVHNYKHQFRDQGLVYPSVRGKKPFASIKPTNIISNLKTRSIDPGKRLKESKFLINGTTVKVSRNAKLININNRQMEICFF